MTAKPSKTAVIGAGAFGTALAIQLARHEEAEVVLWARDSAAVDEMADQRVNQRYLPACRFPAALSVTDDLAETVETTDHLVVAVPSHAFGSMLDQIKPHLRAGQGIVCACKGLETSTGLLPHQVMQARLPNGHPFSVISGPTFATELGLGLPTAMTVASRDDDFAKTIAHALHGHAFRAYTSDDVIGVEVGGASKNVLAIAVGIADGLGLGANTRAALITRGLSEIVRLAVSLGAQDDTLIGLSGLGDIVLTCTDDQSRNRRFGLALGRGTEASTAAESIGTVEGMRAAPELLRLAAKNKVEMPISQQVARVLNGEATPVDALRELAQRPLKSETP